MMLGSSAGGLMCRAGGAELGCAGTERLRVTLCELSLRERMDRPIRLNVIGLQSSVSTGWLC